MTRRRERFDRGDGSENAGEEKLLIVGPGAPPAFMEKSGIVDILLASMLSRLMISARAKDLRSSLSFHEPAVP